LIGSPSSTQKRIGVSAKDGVVTLTGHVDSFPQKREAEKVAGLVSGVKAVACELEVALPPPYEPAAEQALELRLVHAVQGADRTITQESDPGMYDFLFDIARQQIAKMQAEAGTNLDVCIRGGSIGRVVREAALGFQSDLIVIGRGVMQKRLGRLRSSAYSIVREAPCPVMSI
jgi:nucleotide-binding universal stress UspA family protein